MTPEEIYTRGQDLCEAMMAGDVDGVMSRMSQNVMYSDYGVSALDMDFTAVKTFMAGMFKACENMQLKTRSHNGTQEFSVWEWDLECDFAENGQHFGFKKGAHVKMAGCSLQWWNKEGKLYKNHDYASFVRENPES
ncbi:MAG: hypothetical protein M1834_000468 [Cirrosporium novae-zelandiae]|nr:MAG: hypothetical protein M1834_000468 [Cirrosporium novae-zelandiae]